MKTKLLIKASKKKNEYKEIADMVKRASKKAKEIVKKNQKAEKDLFAAFKT